MGDDEWWNAVEEGNVREMRELLDDDPFLDVNATDEEGLTALHLACDKGFSDTVGFLLSQPGIDVNQKTLDGEEETPFMLACKAGDPFCTSHLLRDPRVKLNVRDSRGYTPLRWASFYGYGEIVRDWLISGREMDLGQPGDDFTDAIGIAKSSYPQIATLLESAACSHREMQAASLFALVCFVSEDLLKVRQRGVNRSCGSQFFSVAGRLPPELQMKLCCISSGHRGDTVLSTVSQKALRDLAHTEKT